ncbi:Retrovirus-related Pol polyprotein [Oopsacas minuta]|uniref:Retrovirus-related Pol polyprotein n=1 Tax=Oopsacas minuta TaxID=111878 RepID=A0AAV7K484_9METZ|nr:Retrovirus-related Pol polyprotein [Oopsacas minuta]
MGLDCLYEHQTSQGIIEDLNSAWFLRHRPPEIVLNDQGPNVDGGEIRDAQRKWGIKKCRFSPYHPQGEEQSDRGIQTTKQTLGCMLAEKKLQKESWPKVLQEVDYSLNTIPSASTGLTPYKIMFSVDPKRFLTLDPGNHNCANIDITRSAMNYHIQSRDTNA